MILGSHVPRVWEDLKGIFTGQRRAEIQRQDRARSGWNGRRPGASLIEVFMYREKEYYK